MILFCRLLLCGVVALLAVAAHGEVPPIPVIKIGGNTYSNVTVREVSGSTITLSHSRGMASLNQAKLTRKDLEDLGLIEKPLPPQPKPQRVAVPPPAEGPMANDHQAVSTASADQYVAKLQSIDREQVEELLNQIPRIPIKTVLIVFGGYFFLCFCFLLICSKAGKPAPLLVWLPLFQMFALFRAAGMSPLWFVLLVVDVLLHIGLVAACYLKLLSGIAVLGCAGLLALLAIALSVGWIIWCFKISSARGKSPLVGVMLLLPALNVLALLYLAFSGGVEPKLELLVMKPAPRNDSVEAR